MSKPLPDYVEVEEDALPDYVEVEEAAPTAEAAPAEPPAPPSTLDRLKDPKEWLQGLDRAAVNMIEAVPGAGFVAPVLNAAVDEINPFTPSMDFKDRVKQRKAEWNAKVQPELAAAASVPVIAAAGPTRMLADAGINALQVARNMDVQGKDFTNPDDLVDGAQTTALMTVAPAAAGEAWRSATKFADDAQPFIDFLKKGANRAASNAVGLTKAQLNNLPTNAPDTVGKTLNEATVVRGDIPMENGFTRSEVEPLLVAGDTAETIAPKLKIAKTAEGAKMGEVLETADSVTGGSGKEIRAQVAHRKALDAQERVKERLRNDALKARVGANASMGRARLEAMQDAARRNAEDVLKSTEPPGTVIGPDGLPKPAAPAPTISPDEAAEAAAEKFGGPKVDRPETFAAAGPEGEKVLKKAYLDENVQELPPADPRAFTKNLGFDAHQFIDRAEKELMPRLEDPALAPLKEKMDRLLRRYRRHAERGMSYSDANRMKSTLQSTIRKFQDAKSDQKALLALQGMIGESVDDQLSKIVSEDDFRKFVTASSKYGDFANAAKANNQLIRKEAGNMPTGLVEIVSAGPGAAVGAGVAQALGLPPSVGAAAGAVAAPFTTHAARVRGPSTTAASLRGAARYLEKLPSDSRTGEEIGKSMQIDKIVRALGPERAASFIEWLKSQGPGEGE
jgi:hypothetical protein